MRPNVMWIALVVLAGPALGQSLGERTGINSALGVSPKAQDFVTEAGQSDIFEIETSKLASQQGSDAVKSFANQMVADHSKTSQELKEMATSAKINLPTELSSSQKSTVDKLRNVKGNDFDKQYVDDQVSAHKNAVSLFERYGKGGDNEKLKSWASMTLPALQHHLEMAQNLQKGEKK